jgi:hypothetical protein
LSIDSAYRRIRGEKLFNIEEVAILCKTFKIKFDEEGGEKPNLKRL